MTDSNQIRINELARELEVKAKAIIDYLPEAGVTEKKTHSSSIEVEAAVKVRDHFRALAEAEAQLTRALALIGALRATPGCSASDRDAQIRALPAAHSGWRRNVVSGRGRLGERLSQP